MPSEEADAYGLSNLFQQSSQQPSSQEPSPGSETSSTSEPRPGEPLPAESEELLAGIGGGVPAPVGEEEDGTEEPDEGVFSSIRFEQSNVADVLEEAHAWLAQKFESDHWLLTERQSRMLSGPATELLDSVWVHLQRLLPAILARWAESTPGLMDFVLVLGLIEGPKIAKQFAVSRERRMGKRRPAPRPGPGIVEPMRAAVEPMDSGGLM